MTEQDSAFLEHGNIEPHAPLLKQPPERQPLYKIMKVGDLVRSIEQNYLHFTRVDSYKDFPSADARDGEQLPLDRVFNEGTTFEGAPHYSAADYYDNCRARTYASSFSVGNSPVIWERYGIGDPVGKVGIVFDFGKLRSVLNQTIGNQPGCSALMVGDIQCRQIFYINYGLIDYIDASAVRKNGERLANPIIYSYLKDRDSFGDENELRVTLATLGFGNFALADKTIINFPPSMKLSFDFRKAITEGTITTILTPNVEVAKYLADELAKFRIAFKSDSP